jgi:hypothetical protein
MHICINSLMKASRIYHTKVTVTVEGGKRIAVAMDLYKLPPEEKGYPDGYKFSWIAYDPVDPLNRVLFDVHPPKGPHVHIDRDSIGAPYEWNGLAAAEKFFIAKVQERFGKFTEENE